MRKSLKVLFMGLILSSNLIASISSSTGVPDCWTDSRDRYIAEGSYTLFINTDLIDKSQLMSILRDAGDLINLSASYPDFPMTCGWGSDNCITIDENLHRGVLDGIRNGYENREEVKRTVEEELSLLLIYPGVSISCVIEPR